MKKKNLGQEKVALRIKPLADMVEGVTITIEDLFYKKYFKFNEYVSLASLASCLNEKDKQAFCLFVEEFIEENCNSN